MRKIMTLLACGLLAGCGNRGDKADMGNQAVAQGFVPPAAQRATPLPGQVQTTPLTAYVGKNPNEAVDGVNFLDRTEVALALDDAVGDAAIRRSVRSGAGPRTPIFAAGRRIASWGCEQHDCADRNWTLLIDPTDGKGEVCYHDARLTGAGSRWYAGGAPVARSQDCPSEATAGSAKKES